MPFIETVSRLWCARVRMPVGRGRSAWIAWLIVALVCVQMWGLQHEIVHARGLAGVVDVSSQDRAAIAGDGTFAAAGSGATKVSPDTVDSDDDAFALAANESGQSGTSAYASHIGFGGHHHHCHLFEGATLAAAVAVAVLVWGGATARTEAPLRTTGRSHASVLQLPFDSRAPPVTV